jgi:hypothetical protein
LPKRLFQKIGAGFRPREHLLPRGAEVPEAHQLADIGGLDDHDAPVLPAGLLEDVLHGDGQLAGD